MNTLLLAAGSDMLLVVLMIVGPLIALYGVMQLVGDLKQAPKKKIADRLKGRGRVVETAAGNVSAEQLRKTGPKIEGALAEALLKFSFTGRLQQTLDQANLTISASQFLINQTIAACVIAAVMLVLGVPLLGAAGAVAAVYMLPVFYLVRKRHKRVLKFVDQLPNVFELLGQALRAGHSLASGMQVVAAELPEPAGTEFGRVFQEQNLGLKIEDALLNLADRMDVLDVRFFVTAVLIQRQTGGDLAEVLDKISSVIRDRIKLHQTVMALTAEGRLSGYVLLALPVLVYGAMLRINYDYAMLMVIHPTGQMMGTFAVVSMIMGWVMIKKIVNIKV
ncbi:MAG: type II secretion system F family protein [Phycisphaerae bacterium]